MKRQFLLQKSGFTIFELMLSITIIILFFAFTLSFDWNPRTDSEKSELISVSIAWQLRTEIQNISIWKMPKRDGKIAKMTQITLWTGWLTIVYKSGATTLDTVTFLSPFFEWDSKYVIKAINWTGSSTPLQNTGGIIIIEPSWITFSGSSWSIVNNSLVEIRVWYNLSNRKIIIDRRTGKISELKQ